MTVIVCLRVKVSSVYRAGTSLEEVYAYLSKGLDDGEFCQGELLPSLRELAKKFQVSRAPVHQAILRLEQEGRVHRMHGRGVEVVRPVVTAEPVLKPLVHVVTPLPRSVLNQRVPSVFHHLLEAMDEGLLWHLGQEESVRMQVTFLKNISDFDLRLQECLGTKPDVLVFARPEMLSAETIDLLLRLRRAGTWVIYTANRKEIPEFDRAHSDFFQGQYGLTQHVVAQGAKKLLRFRVPGQLNFEEKKEAGFRLALRERALTTGVTLNAPFLHTDPATEVTALRRVLAEVITAQKIEAILAVNDVQAALVSLALEELGYSDLIVTGYDANWNEIDWEKYFSACDPTYADKIRFRRPPCSVDTQLPQVAEALSRLAVDRALHKLPAQPQTILVRPQLVLEPSGQKVSK